MGEYGFDSNYNYAQHFKPMGVSGGVFMEAPVPKGAPKKGQKPVRNIISEQSPNYAPADSFPIGGVCVCVCCG